MRKLISSDNFLPYDPSLVKLAQKLRREMTAQERKLWYEFLRYHKPPFYRQRPIDYYIVDFYSPAFKLVIELDGIQHASESGREGDRERDMRLQGYGLTILRFWNNEVDENFQNVCDIIEDHLI